MQFDRHVLVTESRKKQNISVVSRDVIYISYICCHQVVGLLLPNPTIGATIFWQWLNQSHNACVNYANKNATKVGASARVPMGAACV